MMAMRGCGMTIAVMSYRPTVCLVYAVDGCRRHPGKEAVAGRAVMIERNSQRTVALILDAARALFLRNGYDATSIQDILDATGLSKGGLYHHFSSKEEVFEAMLERESADSMRAITAIRDDAHMNGAHKLLAFCIECVNGAHNSLWARMAPDASLMSNAKLLTMEYDLSLSDAAHEFMQPIIQQGIRDGSIHTNSARNVAEVLALLANLWVSPMFHPGTSSEVRSRLRTFFDIAQQLWVDLRSSEISGKLDDISTTYETRAALFRSAGDPPRNSPQRSE